MMLDDQLSVLLNTLMESVVGAATDKEWHKTLSVRQRANYSSVRSASQYSITIDLRIADFGAKRRNCIISYVTDKKFIQRKSVC